MNNNNKIWRLQQIPEKSHGLDCWRTDGLKHYGLPELGIHFHIEENEDILQAAAIQVLKKIAAASLEGLTFHDGQMIEGICEYPLFIFNTSKGYMQIVISDSGGQYPWYLCCDEKYKHQIQFNKDKVFYVVTQNKCRIKQLRNEGIIGVKDPGFKKRAEGYIAPIGFISNNITYEDGAVSTQGGLIRYMEQLRRSMCLSDLTIICKDLDYKDPINKHFKKFKEQYIDRNRH